MRLSIIIPAFNEEKTLAELVRKVQQIFLPGYEKELIIIDDGSTDRTPELITHLSQEMSIKSFRHQRNLGKGAAVRTGIREATGDSIMIQDADLEYDPKNYGKMLEALEEADAVYGNRGVKTWPQRGFHYVIGAKFLTWTVNVLFAARLRDLYTGAKVFKSAALKKINLESTGFEFEAEVTCKLLKTGAIIVEVPIEYQPRSLAAGKKIRLKDALKGFWTILKCRFSLPKVRGYATKEP